MSIDFPLQRTLQRNKLLTTLPKLTRSFTVKFQINPTGTFGAWTNVIHLTSTGGNCCNYGDRIPAVFIHARTTRLHICSSVSNKGNHCTDTGNGIPRGQWTDVEITQRPDGNRFRYQVKVGGKIFDNRINTAPREFQNVKVYSADNWYTAGKANIRNLVIIPAAPNTREYELLLVKYVYTIV